MNETRDKIFEFVVDYKERAGSSPSLREIAQAVGVRGASTVLYHIRRDQRLKMLGRRQIEIVTPGPLRCAWCGTIIKADAGAGPQGSDGICQPCLEQHFPDAAQRIAEEGR